MKRPWMLPALGFAGGILASEAVPTWAPALAGLAAIGFLVARWRDWRVVYLLVGWAFAGGLAWWSEQTPLHPSELRLALDDDPHWLDLQGEILEAPTLRLTERRGQPQGRTTMAIQVSAWRERGQPWQPAVGDLMTLTRGVAPVGLFVGVPVEVSGIVRKPAGAVAPGLFDYQEYLRFRGIFHLLEVESWAEWQVVGEQSISRPWSVRFLPWAQRALAYGLPDTESTRLLWAMTLGWKTALTDEVGSGFVEAGTMHVFAISGLHIALLAGVLVALLRLLRVNRIWCVPWVVPTIWLYVAATGWQPSAIRSAVMMTVVVGGWALRRPGEVLNSLALSALLILVVRPGEIFQPGFQLSFTAVGGLALWSTSWGSRIQRVMLPVRDPFLPESLQPRWRENVETGVRWLAQSLAVSLAALVATLPFVVHYFHVFSPISLVANVVVVPLSGLALAANVGSLLTFEWLPVMAGLFNASAWLWMSAMTGLSRWFAEVPGGVWFVAGPPQFYWLAYYALLITPAWTWFHLPRGRCLWWLALGGSLAVAVGTGLRARQTVELGLLPGGAVVVDGPGVRRDLILNSGGARHSERLLRPWLRVKGWNDLPQLGITQADAAHAGGATNLLRELPPREIFVRSRRQRSPMFRQFIADADRLSLPVREVGVGERVGEWTVVGAALNGSLRTAADTAFGLVGNPEGVDVLILPELGPAGIDHWLSHSIPGLERIDVMIAEVSARNSRPLRRLVERVDPRLLVLIPAGGGSQAAPLRFPGNPTPRFEVVLARDQAGFLSLRRGTAELKLIKGGRWELPARPKR